MPENPNHTSVRDRILALTDPNLKLQISNDFDDLTISIPPREGLSKMKYDKFVRSYIDNLFTFLDTPIITYSLSTDQVTDSNIHAINNAIVASFNSEDEKEVRRVLYGNRMRVNSLTLARSSLDSLAELVDESVKKNNIARIKSNMPVLEKDRLPIYENLPVSERIKVIKYFTKASEMTLKVLAEESLEDKDWEVLESFTLQK